MVDSKPKEDFVLRLMIRIACCGAVVLAASLALAQSEFSAEIVNSKNEGNAPSKVYFGKDKIRFESPENKSEGGAFIMDLSNQNSIVLMPKQHMYMEMPQHAMDSRGMFHFFKSGDAENACPDWL